MDTARVKHIHVKASIFLFALLIFLKPLSKLNNIFQSAGVKFPQRPPDIPKPNANPHVDKQTSPKEESAAPQLEANAPRTQAHGVPESRYNFANMFNVPIEHVKECLMYQLNMLRKNFVLLIFSFMMFFSSFY